MRQKAPLPQILCLHGGGSNAAIFHAQTRFIRHALRDRFEFIYVDAPFESDPGPGILPTFEDCGPYFRWTAMRAGEDEGRAAWQILRRLVEEEPGVVGLLGFSQGVRAVMGLLLRQQKQQQTAPPTTHLRFAVCAMGGEAQPLRLSEAWYDEAIRIPTIHVYGLRDPILTSSRRLLARNFDPASVKVLAADAGHHMPNKTEETARLADMVLETWYLGAGAVKDGLVADVF
ncbi:MAG: hypothetical protein M1813_000914 [Trichoglossum hirsutum]|nr:MAG: hypothetical protein M1813_000914 [Trichoglossum hirsutum]